MKFSLRTLLPLVLVAATLGAVIASRYSPVELSVGMTFDRVEYLLHHAGAEELEQMHTMHPIVSKGLSTSPVSERPYDKMWNLPRLNIHVDTVFKNDQLIEIDIWNWTGRKWNTWHHMMEYDSVDALRIPILDGTYKARLLEKHSPGENPPVCRSGG